MILTTKKSYHGTPIVEINELDDGMVELTAELGNKYIVFPAELDDMTDIIEQ